MQKTIPLDTRMNVKVPTGAMTKLLYIRLFVFSTEVQVRSYKRSSIFIRWPQSWCQLCGFLFSKLCTVVEKKLWFFTKIVNFTDGCSSQYKSKIPFMDISCSKDDLDIEVERHFFGSGHGKGPVDGCSGVVKAAWTRAVIAGNVLSTAGDIFSFVTKNVTKDDELFKRTFVFVDKKDAPRQRSLRKEALTIPGTRQLYCVKSVAQGKVLTRKSLLHL